MFPWQLNTPDQHSSHPTSAVDAFQLPRLTDLQHPGDSGHTHAQDSSLSGSGLVLDSTPGNVVMDHNNSSSLGNSIAGGTSALEGLEGIFDFDVDVNFNLDGFWDDFTLGEGQGGFPFR